MADNKVISFRLGPDLLKELEQVQDVQRWTTSQALSELLAWRKRLQERVSCFHAGSLPDGTRIVVRQEPDPDKGPGWFTGGADVIEGDGVDALLEYLLVELNKPVNVSFMAAPDLDAILES